jgi:hypothetical protein
MNSTPAKYFDHFQHQQWNCFHFLIYIASSSDISQEIEVVTTGFDFQESSILSDSGETSSVLLPSQ